MLRVNVGRSGDTSLLEINVEIDSANASPVKNGVDTRRAQVPPAARLEPETPAPG